MFRSHGRPDLLREEEAIDELGAVVRVRRRIALVAAMGASGLVASLALAAAATWGATDVSAGITGRALGMIFAGGLFGSFIVTHRLARGYTRAWAEARARDLARARRCEEESLVEAARMFSGG